MIPSRLLATDVAEGSPSSVHGVTGAVADFDVDRLELSKLTALSAPAARSWSITPAISSLSWVPGGSSVLGWSCSVCSTSGRPSGLSSSQRRSPSSSRIRFKASPFTARQSLADRALSRLKLLDGSLDVKLAVGLMSLLELLRCLFAELTVGGAFAAEVGRQAQHAERVGSMRSQHRTDLVVDLRCPAASSSVSGETITKARVASSATSMFMPGACAVVPRSASSQRGARGAWRP